MIDGAWAKGGRDFAASYQFANVSESNGEVHVTITLNLRNNSGANISNASVVLLNSGANPTVLGLFGDPQLLQRTGLNTMSHAFTIPKTEYQVWEQGRDPALRVISADASGAMRMQWIDLQRRVPGVGAIK
jgi:hypothetical protein